MNERLKQLAIESKLIAPEYNGFDHTRLSISQQRFAELIVRECIEQVITGPNGPAHYAVEAAIRLKKHFGVEE
jgi:hypothetical protein